MKRIAAVALFVAATLITTGSAWAQDHAVKATVPFNFTLNGNTLPAGSYTIASDSTNAGTLSIRNRQEGVNAWVLGMIDSTNTGKAGQLVFHKCGDRLFLSEIRYPYSSTKVRFPMSKMEKRAREHTLEAGLQVNNDVLIALN
jgi:hypothetical protein